MVCHLAVECPCSIPPRTRACNGRRANVLRVRNRLRRDLTSAMKARDGVTVAALRTALAALDDAEAVPLPTDGEARDPAGGHVARSEHVAGSAVGVGAAEVPRRVLGAAEAAGVVRSQAAELAAAADEYDRWARPQEAARLRAQAEVLLAYLPGGA